jgi:hypothetical protein
VVEDVVEGGALVSLCGLSLATACGGNDAPQTGKSTSNPTVPAPTSTVPVSTTGRDAATTSPAQTHDAGLTAPRGVIGATPTSWPERDTGAPVPPAGACVEAQIADGGGYTGSPSYTRRTWDPVKRILKVEAFRSFSLDIVQTLETQFADDGGPLRYIGVEQPFQEDYTYDDHGGITDFIQSYPAVARIDVPSTAPPSLEYTFSNQYDASGKPLTSTKTPSGTQSPNNEVSTRTYTEDADGRCGEVDTTATSNTTKEVRTYTASGKTVHTTTTGQLESTSDDVFDAMARPVSSTFTLSSKFGGGSIRTTHTYLPDGSERVETFDGTTDVVNEQHSVTTRPAACLVIDAAIGHAKDDHCHIEF